MTAMKNFILGTTKESSNVTQEKIYKMLLSIMANVLNTKRIMSTIVTALLRLIALSASLKAPRNKRLKHMTISRLLTASFRSKKLILMPKIRR